MTIEPGPSDSTVFESLETLAVTTAKSGYYGGVRLLRALCFKFQEYCAERIRPAAPSAASRLSTSPTSQHRRV